MNSGIAALGWIGSWELSFLFYELATWRVSAYKDGGIGGRYEDKDIWRWKISRADPEKLCGNGDF